MGISKAPPPVPYTDDPLPSSTSAHSLDPLNDLPPPYTDHPDSTPAPPFPDPDQHPLHLNPPGLIPVSSYHTTDPTYHPPPLPSSRLDTKSRTTWTQHGPFSLSADALELMIKEQSRFPPHLSVTIRGTHERSYRDGKSDRHETVTDFNFHIDVTLLLSRRIGAGDPFLDGRIRVIDEGRRGYRGGRLRGYEPHVAWEEDREGESTRAALREWCERYVADGAGWKSFGFKRWVEGFDKVRVRQLVESAVRGTGYMGPVHVDFSERQNEVIVFSPGRINALRTMVWVRWLFYLTFLWIVSWPVLFFLTKRYEVVDGVYQYRAGGTRYGSVAVQDEGDWFAQWERSIQRAAWGRVRGEIDWRYRQDTEDAFARGSQGQTAAPVSTGNSVVDGMVNVLGMGADFVGQMDRRMGWGRDEC
ncbi:hypothetical protein KVT40_005914 [Elsinoe batatas]|uniref:Uncharacterized protein n=1 Tax=Elsinoe batatas TaxID=2601811 RepID=A0A8K0PIS8_9PEZI|nr:hypothetical protein KVT40_005914 [Elsinoe batatas]